MREESNSYKKNKEVEKIRAHWEKTFSIADIDQPTEHHSCINKNGEHQVYCWSNNIEIANLDIFLRMWHIRSKVWVAYVEEREDS